MGGGLGAVAFSVAHGLNTDRATRTFGIVKIGVAAKKSLL